MLTLILVDVGSSPHWIFCYLERLDFVLVQISIFCIFNLVVKLVCHNSQMILIVDTIPWNIWTIPLLLLTSLIRYMLFFFQSWTLMILIFSSWSMLSSDHLSVIMFNDSVFRLITMITEEYCKEVINIKVFFMKSTFKA